MKNASMNPELGQIEYVFTDKTGTLTENNMSLNSVFVQNKFYYASPSSCPSSSSSSSCPSSSAVSSSSSSLMPIDSFPPSPHRSSASVPYVPSHLAAGSASEADEEKNSMELLVEEAFAPRRIEAFVSEGEASVAMHFFLSLLLCNSAVVVHDDLGVEKQTCTNRKKRQIF